MAAKNGKKQVLENKQNNNIAKKTTLSLSRERARNLCELRGLKVKPIVKIVKCFSKGDFVLLGAGIRA